MTARVLVVDDSATMRGLIGSILDADPQIEVVGYANDPLEAREAIKALRPDVVTLDVEMPNMNGLAFLERLMRLRPMPVVMVSTLTQAGADVTLAALEIGAIDYVAKPASGLPIAAAFAELPEKVKAAARAKPRASADAPAKPSPPSAYAPGKAILGIGSSTGGVEALITVLSAFPANCPPTVITQHMPGTFTRSFAERLNRACAATVEEATDGAPLEVGRVYIAPGGERHLEVAGGSSKHCRLREGPPVNGHRPSVDVLFESIAKTGGAAVGMILTGMGGDGARGLKAMRDAGAHTLGQDEASCVVYGMPRVAFECGAVERQAPLSRLAGLALDLCSLRKDA